MRLSESADKARSQQILLDKVVSPTLGFRSSKWSMDCTGLAAGTERLVADTEGLVAVAT